LVTIVTENRTVTEEDAALADIEPGEDVLVSVTDNGVGMPPGVAAKAFEPFFTTKGVGKGTGLGLSQVFGFVAQSGGYLKLKSEPGVGTSIDIYLPRLHGDAMASRQVFRQLPDAAGEDNRGLTILVVEDDDHVRAFSVEAARELGY
jgi:nitrogen-specific signal transduction histidine kinase